MYDTITGDVNNAYKVLLANYIFWFLLVFLILILVSHFRKKKIQIPSKVN